jgi:predicted AlkP superfamily phosphohydrolase/phosphomutase/tetratricopeptide (TPR) repeat protein
MPNLARLIAGGVHGNVATIYPVLSPMLWTSIATGKRAYKHGIHGFSEPLPDGSGVRPITVLSRKTKAVWNILNQAGHRSVVVGWWPSHPAEPLNGVMVSNHFQQAVSEPGAVPPLPAGAVYPPSLAASLGELRVNPMELTGEFIQLFVPEYEKVDQAKDKRLHSLGKIIAETMSVHAAATELLATQAWDFAAIYYDGIDHFEHGFMNYHPPRLPWVTEEDFAIYRDVVANAYRYHDAMLGALLALADENTTVILMSDHGFHPDHLRPGYIPAEPAGPAVEHRHFGILCLKGPGLRVNQPVLGASLLDICPTILTLFGLPPGKDMDGKVLLNAFEQPPSIDPIETWDSVSGDAGVHSPETQIDPVASAEAFKQLVELGYLAPPGPNARENVEECVRELKYNLARSYRDGDCCGEAAALARGLWDRWPKEHRFGILLADCLAAVGQVTRRRSVIEELGRRIDRYQAEAQTELTRRKEQKDLEPKKEPAPENAQQRRAQFEERQLAELAFGRPLLLDCLLLGQALLEKHPDEARRCVEKLARAENLSYGMDLHLAGAMAELGDFKEARAVLEAALASDPESAPVHSQLARVHLRAGNLGEAIAAATESLSLLYFQPAMHALIGQALMESKRFAEAEQELRVAVSQSPRNLAAHELLGRLYREHLDRPGEAFAHEGRAASLRNELAARQRDATAISQAQPQPPVSLAPPGRPVDPCPAPAPPFGPEVDRDQIITVVSGLPRSGTSMMMQLLAAAGRQPLTDARRAADEDNPLGYFEIEKALDLPKDASWVPQARGKVVKIVAQLLRYLPRNEHYHVLFMERNLAEVVASQTAMLARQGRRGADLGGGQLLETYAAQLQRVRKHMASRAEIRTLRVDYGTLLAGPEAGVGRIAEFLGEPFNRKAASQSVRPDLRRQNQSGAS